MSFCRGFGGGVRFGLAAGIFAASAWGGAAAQAQARNGGTSTTNPSDATTLYFGDGTGAAPAAAATAPAEPAAAKAPVTTGAITDSATSSPVIAAALKKLSQKSLVGRNTSDDVAALSAFYTSRGTALWVKDGALTANATALIDEIRKAGEFGLEASAFDLPEVAGGATSEAQGEAEAKISLAALKYARQARGGRVTPLSISNIWDMTPPVKDPKDVVNALAGSDNAAAYLKALHPKHPQFEKLRQALAKARGPQEDIRIDDALKVKLPAKGTVKPGAEHEDIALLRKRLKIEAQSAENEKLYDARLEGAVRTFQEEHDIKADGVLNARTRAALNDEGEPKRSSGKGEIDRILVNMERWRWLPEDLGQLHVQNNIPEFVGRVYKGSDTVWEERIIIGQTTWPTPILTSSMEFVIFRPEWGVPDGIKMKELLPRLKRASGGGGFFDELFGGGSSGGARVLAAYGLKPSINGRPIDANAVNWNSVDIRQFSFTQPAGGQNPLGDVKFRFPNRHDVYMHDTTQRALFAQSYRALSHGCIRVQNPRKLAEVLLGEDKGWDEGKVRALFNSGGEVTLAKPVPVYLTYFTARVDNDGKLRTFKDLYGHDGRLLSALAGRAVRYDAPEESRDDVVASAEDDNFVPASEPGGSKKKSASSRKSAAPVAKKRGDTTGDIMSGLIAN